MMLKGDFDLKLGKTFTDSSAPSFMTVRYDFMPASVDKTNPGSISFEDGKSVSVDLPAISGSIHFDGPARPVSKECVLIYNKRTKQMSLERISHVAQLKKCRESDPKLSFEKVEVNPTPSKPVSSLSKLVKSMSDSDSSEDEKVTKKQPKPQKNSTTDLLKELCTELSCSDSDDDSFREPTPPHMPNNAINSNLNRNLIESDLKLSESDSDSD
ncbi:chromatin modification- protein VID21 [Cichlidogyrus casuarinus]|uniref:Chromatin modification- protein VID21 n=1 Tax=Cichlidogyrus casuarinus TaxID=1844966 RepID=A0ABD2QMF0_9PLAT